MYISKVIENYRSQETLEEWEDFNHINEDMMYGRNKSWLLGRDRLPDGISDIRGLIEDDNNPDYIYYVVENADTEFEVSYYLGFYAV